jgi:AcrR family transcriptional regulator
MSRSRKKAGPDERLSRERIVEAALAVIEREGLAGFSTRKLAAELGCEAMSIYHYFPSKGHLMDALADRIISEMPPLPPADLPWIERLRMLGHGWRATVTKRPALFTFLATFRMNTPTCLAWLDGVIGLFCESGLSREEGARLFRAYGYYLMGTGLDETAGYARGPSTVEPVPDDIMQRDFPNVVAVGPYFRPSEYDKTFEMGLDLFLDSVERLVEERTQARARQAATR